MPLTSRAAWLQCQNVLWQHKLHLTVFENRVRCSLEKKIVEPTVFLCSCTEAYLDLNGPCKVADIDKERYVRAVSEIEVLVGEAVFELLNVAPRDDRDLLPGLGSCWMTERRTKRRDTHGNREQNTKQDIDKEMKDREKWDEGQHTSKINPYGRDR